MVEGDRRSGQISCGRPLEDPTTAANGCRGVQPDPTSQTKAGSPVERHEPSEPRATKNRSTNSETIANQANIRRNQSVFQRPASASSTLNLGLPSMWGKLLAQIEQAGSLPSQGTTCH